MQISHINYYITYTCVLSMYIYIIIMNVQSLYNNICNVMQIMALSTYNIFNVVYYIYYITIHIYNTLQYTVLFVYSIPVAYTILYIYYTLLYYIVRAAYPHPAAPLVYT